MTVARLDSRRKELVGIAHALSSWKLPGMRGGEMESNTTKEGGEDNCKYRVSRNH